MAPAGTGAILTAILKISGRGLPLRGDDIDTDRIMPIRRSPGEFGRARARAALLREFGVTAAKAAPRFDCVGPSTPIADG